MNEISRYSISCSRLVISSNLDTDSSVRYRRFLSFPIFKSRRNLLFGTKKRFFAFYSLIRLCPFRRTTRYTTPVRHYSNTVYPVQPTVQQIPSGERTRLSSHAETENMERGRVVNRHVAPRTNTVSSFREVSEGAGNAGLHRGRALMLSLASKVKSLARSATIVARKDGGREE